MLNTKEQISRNMRSNKSKDTKPEIMLRHELWRRGLRYRKIINISAVSRISSFSAQKSLCLLMAECGADTIAEILVRRETSSVGKRNENTI